MSGRRTPRSAGLPFTIPLDAASTEPLFRQVYRALREAILSGGLRPGTKLPSTRVLAAELRIARNTAALAYDYLEAEGYVRTARGSGTYVSRGVARASPPRVPSAAAPAPMRLSRAGTALLRDPDETPAAAGTPRPFRLGEPGVDAFPARFWSRLLAQHARRAGAELLSYGDANGYRLLRRAILEYVTAARGVHAELEQVFLVRGAQQAVDVVARVLLDGGDEVWVEDPGYLSTRSILRLNAVVPVAVPVDRDGLIITEGVRSSPHARAVVVTPSNHFPLSVTLSLARRLELTAWAAAQGAWILEDDYDSEFHYAGRPLPCLQGLQRSGQVLYIGTFSKTMFPALRLGYLIVPPQLVTLFQRARDRLDAMLPNVEQAALADFIARGEYPRHVRRMRELYRDRQAVLVQQAQTHLSPWLHIAPVAVGMQVVAWLHGAARESRAVQLAAEAGIEVRPLSLYGMEQKLAPGLVLGFAAYDEATIARAVQALASAFTRGQLMHS